MDSESSLFRFKSQAFCGPTGHIKQQIIGYGRVLAEVVPSPSIPEQTHFCATPKRIGRLAALTSALFISRTTDSEIDRVSTFSPQNLIETLRKAHASGRRSWHNRNQIALDKTRFSALTGNCPISHIPRGRGHLNNIGAMLTARMGKRISLKLCQKTACRYRT